MKKHFKKIIIVLIVLAGLFVFFKIKNSGKSKAITNTVVQSKSLQETVYLSGQLTALSQAKINFTADSKITWVGVKAGDTVKKYQSLAKQDTTEVEKSLKTSLNNFMASRESFD
jgi:macrolide-specific efflux system membrane fusion protein